MNKNKKSFATLTIVALLLVVISLVAVSGTYAKYTTSLEGKAQAIVAKWDFKATDGTTEITDTSEFTINLADYCTTGLVTVGGVEKIQPGSEGTLVVTVVNDGDVDALVEVTSTAITGSVLDADQFTFTVPAANTTVAAHSTGNIQIAWEWNYEVGTGTTDEDDTRVGTTSNYYTNLNDLIGLKITGTQVNPGV